MDRVLAEASLDFSRFLEPSIGSLKKCAAASKRVVLGAVPQQIAAVAEEEKADLVIMSPRRHAGLRHWLFGVDYRSGYPIEPVPGFVDRGTPAIETLARQARPGLFQVAANAHCQHLKATCA